MDLLEAKINGVWTALPYPKPKNYSVTYTHLENSYVNTRGYLKRDIIRRNRAKVFCGYDGLTGDEMALLQSLYEFDSFMLRFTDTYNNRVEKEMYAGPLEGKAALLDTTDMTITYHTDVQMNFVEV